MSRVPLKHLLDDAQASTEIVVSRFVEFHPRLRDPRVSLEGGHGMRPPKEITYGDYPGLAQFLMEAGAAMPERIGGGSDAVQDVLRRAGVPE